MHELTLCLNILDALQKQAKEQGFHHVKKLWLEVGDLVGVELDALQFSFPIAASGTVAENAVLDVVSVPGRAWCHRCEDHVVLTARFTPCPQCGECDHRITQGNELRIVKMEVM